MPRPWSSFSSSASQKSRTRLTTNASICVTGGRSKETPRYLGGTTESMPRSRARATIRERQSQGRATSSGPRIQPEPSQMPSLHGWRSLVGEWMANSGFPRAGEGVSAAAQVLDRRSLARRLLDRLLLARPVGELGVVLEEDQADRPDRAVAVLREDQLGSARVLGLGVVVVVAVQEPDDVGVLLDRPGLSEVGEDGPLVRPLFGGAGELRDADDRNLELAGKDLQSTAELRDLLHAIGASVVASHQLHVVDDHH